MYFVLLITAILLLAGCRALQGDRETFQLGVEVTSGDRTFAGTGVRMLRLERRLKVTAETPSVVWHESGEATVVPLHDGQALYVLLDGSDLPTATVAKIVNPDARGKKLIPALRDTISEGRSAALSGYAYVERYDRYRFPYPRMVYFLDQKDPTTMRFVRPGGVFSIGRHSYRVTALWVEAPASPSKERPVPRLPWLSHHDGGLSDTTLGLSQRTNPPSPVVFSSNFETR